MKINNMTITFADVLKQCSIETWQKILNHRFIIELSKDILPVNKFLFYLKQDYYFLEEFSKFLQSAIQKTTNNKIKEWLDSLYMSTVNFEMEMQRQILDSLEVSSSSSSRPPPAPNSLPTSAATIHNIIIIPSKVTINYTSYLKHISSSGTFSEIISVMAPCPWTYLEIAQQLSKFRIQNKVYRNWVKFYSLNEFRKQVDEIKQILNMLSQNENEKSKEIMKNHFINACKYEFLFWEMAYNLYG
jgi:thiaminase/transcriptional activator TenA